MMQRQEKSSAAPRQPAVAGRFYPDDPRALRAMVDDHLAAARPAGSRPPLALIAPHAGYIYSGPIAATAYSLLRAASQRIRRVVLLGPSHYVPFHGVALSTAGAFLTPLGPVPVDAGARHALQSIGHVLARDDAHAPEHSLEVHLPFLQVVLDEFSVIPLVVGDASPAEVAAVIEPFWGVADTLVVVSSDLSHFHDYESARRLDDATSAAIERLDEEFIDPAHACGCRPVNGLLRIARRHGLRARLLDQRSSGDTAGDRRSVVGYGAYAFDTAPAD